MKVGIHAVKYLKRGSPVVNDVQVHCRADGCDDEVHGEHDSDCGWSEARRSHDDSDEA